MLANPVILRIDTLFAPAFQVQIKPMSDSGCCPLSPVSAIPLGQKFAMLPEGFGMSGILREIVDFMRIIIQIVKLFGHPFITKEL